MPLPKLHCSREAAATLQDAEEEIEEFEPIEKLARLGINAGKQP